jgi:hypothetical protein
MMSSGEFGWYLATLQAYESGVIDIRHWKVILRPWKNMQIYHPGRFAHSFSWHEMIGKDSYVGSVGPQNMFGGVVLKSFGTEAFLTFSKSVF